MGKKLGRNLPRRSLVNRDLTAVGALFISQKTGRGLFLLRDQDTYSNTWGLVGGQLETSETLYGGLVREISMALKHEIALLEPFNPALYIGMCNRWLN